MQLQVRRSYASDVHRQGPGLSAARVAPLYRTDRQSWIVQGRVVTDPGELAQMDIPPGEVACEIPDRLVPFFMQQEE